MNFNEQKFLFTAQKKRKDDMMSSLLKYAQRQIVSGFKARSPFRLMRHAKQAFREQFFESDPDGSRVFHSNLFNRRDIGCLAKNAPLMKEMARLYAPESLEKIVEKYCFEGGRQGWLGASSEEAFSKFYLKQLGKKPMRLQDVLYCFFNIEFLLEEGLYPGKGGC